MNTIGAAWRGFSIGKISVYYVRYASNDPAYGRWVMGVSVTGWCAMSYSDTLGFRYLFSRYVGEGGG